MVHKLTLAYIYAHEYGSKVNTSLCRSVMKAISHILFPCFIIHGCFFKWQRGHLHLNMFAAQVAHQPHGQ